MKPLSSSYRYRGRSFFPAVLLFFVLFCWTSGIKASDLPPNDDLRFRAWRYKPCHDREVAHLRGLERNDALKKVRAMGLMVVRFLAPTASVTYEVFPERLTLIIDDRDRILRAFCR